MASFRWMSLAFLALLGFTFSKLFVQDKVFYFETLQTFLNYGSKDNYLTLSVFQQSKSSYEFLTNGFNSTR